MKNKINIFKKTLCFLIILVMLADGVMTPNNVYGFNINDIFSNTGKNTPPNEIVDYKGSPVFAPDSKTILSKPIANFVVNDVMGIPIIDTKNDDTKEVTLKVGDKISFKDDSKVGLDVFGEQNSPDEYVSKFDFQWFFYKDGVMIDQVNHMDSSIENKSITLGERGEDKIGLYLCVSASTNVHGSYSGLWSENGIYGVTNMNNPNYPNGVIWHYVSIIINVEKDVTPDLIVDYIDTDTGLIIDTDIKTYGTILTSTPSPLTYTVKEVPGYKMGKWDIYHNLEENKTKISEGTSSSVAMTFTDKEYKKRVIVYVKDINTGDGGDDGGGKPEPEKESLLKIKYYDEDGNSLGNGIYDYFIPLENNKKYVIAPKSIPKLKVRKFRYGTDKEIDSLESKSWTWYSSYPASFDELTPYQTKKFKNMELHFEMIEGPLAKLIFNNKSEINLTKKEFEEKNWVTKL